MGIKGWFKKKAPVQQKEQQLPEVKLPELDKDALFEETLEALNSENIELEQELVIETVPEYDSGEVEIYDLMDEEMESNYELNTVEETEIEDMLADAQVIGDVPEEVDL